MRVQIGFQRIGGGIGLGLILGVAGDGHAAAGEIGIGKAEAEAQLHHAIASGQARAASAAVASATHELWKTTTMKAVCRLGASDSGTGKLETQLAARRVSRRAGPKFDPTSVSGTPPSVSPCVGDSETRLGLL